MHAGQKWGLGLQASFRVLVGEGEASHVVGQRNPRAVQFCVPLCDDVCLCLCACVCSCTVLWQCRYELLPQTCPCLLPGKMAVPGRPGMQNREGKHPQGLSAPYSFPQHLTMHDCLWGGGSGRKVEGGERLTSQLCHLPFRGLVLIMHVCVHLCLCPHCVV